MRSLVLLFFVCCALPSRGQDSENRSGIISGVRQRLNSLISATEGKGDSVIRNSSIDTLHLPVDSLKNSRAKLDAAKHRIDSIQNRVNGNNKLTKTTDSINAIVSRPVDQVTNKVENLQKKTEGYMQQKLDSAERKINGPLDKVNSGITSVENQVEDRMDQPNQVVQEKTHKIQTGVQNGLEKATDGTVKSPIQNIDLPEVGLPKKPNISDVDLNSPSVPGLKGEGIPDASVPKVSSDLPKIDTETYGLNGTNVKQQKNLAMPETDKLDGAREKIDDVDTKLAELERYEQELKGLKNLDSASVESATKKAEERIMNLEQMKGVQDQMKVVANKQAEYDALVQRYRDTTLTSQEFARKARNLVNEKINKNVPDVKEAMDVLNKVKSAKEILTQKNNGLAGKPIGQRLIPGITLQSSKGDVFMIDFGLQLGYRLTGRLRSGVGGIYRLGFDESYNTFVKAQDVYGGRVYTQFLIRKGIYVHAEYELLNSPDILSATETRQNVSSAYFGLGKQFNISKKVKGHTLFLYRAELKGELPDQSKVTLRLGFDLRTKKKKKGSSQK